MFIESIESIESRDVVGENAIIEQKTPLVSAMAIPGAGKGGIVPPPEHRFKPGNAGGGRKSIGASVREWLSALDGEPRDVLERIARSRVEPASRVMAAQALLRAIDRADPEEFEDVIGGKRTLKELRAAGVPTRGIKRMKLNAAGGLDIELRSDERDDAAFIVDHTDGKAIQRIATDSPPMLAVQISVPGLSVGELMPPADVPKLADGSDTV
jgi:hypothetical protein